MNSIVIKTEKRPCYIEGKRAIFHRWSERAAAINESPMIGGHPGGFIKWTAGIVEFEDGTVKEVDPEKIRFADSGMFLVMAWKNIPVNKEGQQITGGKT